jgi:hypothetical protein
MYVCIVSDWGVSLQEVLKQSKANEAAPALTRRSGFIGL